MRNPPFAGPCSSRKPSNLDGLLSQLYTPCDDMPNALQAVLDQLALRERAATMIEAGGDDAAANTRRTA